jgi:hypothetical protein
LRQQSGEISTESPLLAGASFTGMLSESKKYGLCLILAMQYVDQLEESVRNAAFENVGTLMVFRVGPTAHGILHRSSHRRFQRNTL